MTSGVEGNVPWWQQAVFYQIYPLSFADSDGDGYGDLEGVISKLDYFSEIMQVDALWLSPFYKSPMRDWGYDISDHTDVDPLFGDLETAERLIDEAHKRGLKIVFDYVMNHTSDEHPWFRESRSSRDNPKREWYVWRDPDADGSPPNNWGSVFGGPAWTMDEATGQYYRHTFLPHQPDLNWRNEEVVQAALGVARFWLDRDIDGFRLDAAHQIMKDPLERDNPPSPENLDTKWKDMGEYDAFLHVHDMGHQDIHDVYRRFRSVVDSYGKQIFTIGEIHIFDLNDWASYYGENLNELHMPFNFHLIACDWDAETIRTVIESVLKHIPADGWPNWTLGNHDEKRLATRVGPHNARLAAMLLLTLRGTPFLYYGDELGMENVAMPNSDPKDPWGRNVPDLNRDGARTPMQWTADESAGFTTGDPWLPLIHDYPTRNVEIQSSDPSSILSLYRRLLMIRRESPALRLGSFSVEPASDEHVLVYRRARDDDAMTIALNLSDVSRRIEIQPGKVILSTLDLERPGTTSGVLTLSPREGVIVSH